MRHSLLLAAITTALLAACGEKPATETPSAEAAPSPVADNTPVQAAVAHDPAIRAEDFMDYTRTLASDEFAGRAPGTQGETLTIEYLRDQFKAMGLKPGNGDSYFQSVPMVETTAEPMTAKVVVNGKPQEWAFGTQWVAGTRTGEPTIEVVDSPLVFVGYGVNAPELNWNDYAGLDVKGKTVVVLINDPGFHVNDPDLFGGKRMTYYGRWTYKFEEAARQGATGAIIIHDTDGAAYGWGVVENGWSGPQFDLPAANDPEPRLPMQGWITGEVAQDLLAQSGMSLEALRLAANKPGFKSVELPATLSTTIKSSIKTSESQNVLAMIEGTERPDEVVIYTAHWDHMGTMTDANGNVQIFNGAIDNATGVAGIMEIAHAFTQQPPKRSVLFAAVTLEESGLLGSKYYVADPVFPMNKTVGVINLDAMSVIGKTRDFVVTGYGASELEDILRPLAAAQGRELRSETDIEKGFYFRSDHFNFAKAGVPALYAKSGGDHVEHGPAHGAAVSQDYIANRYHKPGDKFDPNWDASGVVQDLEALYGVGRALTDGESWPNWYQGHAFRALRDAERAKVTSEQ